MAEQQNKGNWLRDVWDGIAKDPLQNLLDAVDGLGGRIAGMFSSATEGATTTTYISTAIGSTFDNPLNNAQMVSATPGQAVAQSGAGMGTSGGPAIQPLSTPQQAFENASAAVSALPIAGLSAAVDAVRGIASVGSSLRDSSEASLGDLQPANVFAGKMRSVDGPAVI